MINCIDVSQSILLQMVSGSMMLFSAGVERGLAEGKSLGLAEGEARGKSLGLAEGSRQKALETARNLLVIGLSIDNIAKATGLTAQEVETLN